MVLTIFITYLNAMQGTEYGGWAFLGAIAFDLLMFSKVKLITIENFKYKSVDRQIVNGDVRK